jgi:hypothetical protein
MKGNRNPHIPKTAFMISILHVFIQSLFKGLAALGAVEYPIKPLCISSEYTFGKLASAIVSDGQHSGAKIMHNILECILWRLAIEKDMFHSLNCL